MLHYQGQFDVERISFRMKARLLGQAWLLASVLLAIAVAEPAAAAPTVAPSVPPPPYIFPPPVEPGAPQYGGTPSPVPMLQPQQILRANPNADVFTDISDPALNQDCSNGTFPLQEDYEWRAALANRSQLNDQSQLYGSKALTVVSGTAVHPGYSKADLWFSHPFGYDYEYYIVPDQGFMPLLNTGGNNPTSDFTPSQDDPRLDYRDAINDAKTLGVSADSGVIGMEIDGQLVPRGYSANDGDRVVSFGRWIVDCGHAPFHTEIHPPLVSVIARATSPVPASTVPSPIASPTNSTGTSAASSTSAVSGSPSSSTTGSPPASTSGFGPSSVSPPPFKPLDKTTAYVSSLPWLVSQRYEDGRPFLGHFVAEIVKLLIHVLSVIPLSEQAEAHVGLIPPFAGVQQLTFFVQAPRLPNLNEVALVNYHFVERTGVHVNLFNAGAGTVGVTATLDGNRFRMASPGSVQPCYAYESDLRRNPTVSLVLDLIRATLSEPGAFSIANGLLTALTGGIFTLGLHPLSEAEWEDALADGVKYNCQYTGVPRNFQDAHAHDAEVVGVPVNSLRAADTPPQVVDDTQPFPIYGWISIEWAAQSAVTNPSGGPPSNAENQGAPGA
jgi:hypothetical protein